MALRGADQVPCDHPCKADPKWFFPTAKPTFEKPDPDQDCDFYRPAWQYLLYLIQEDTPGCGPRLFALDHPDDLFRGEHAGRFPVAKKGILRLAPRVALSRDPLGGTEINQAGSNGILVDPKTGRAVYYAVHLNETFSKFIRDNKYENALNLKNAPPDQEFPRGAAEFKTSWRVLADDDPGDGYVTATATISKLANKNGDIVIDPMATEPNKRVALLGVHVVFVLDGHPEFIWATFEHNENAPELNPKHVDKPPGATVDGNPVDNAKDWSLYKKGTPANQCNKNNKGHLTLNADQTLTPVTNVFRQFHFGNDDEPCVIETLNQSVYDGITANLSKVTNADAKKRMEALKNYSLRGAMWLNNPAYFREGVDFALLDEKDPAKKILGGDPQLSNAVIETFTQPWKPMGMRDDSRQSSFCFDCHRTVAKSKGSVSLPALRLNVSQTLVQRYFLAAGAP
ncbi:MAG: hypothetical protein J2P46_04480 [Zavarzinella sp.]|nr:hypothetical protein [Zavarzinella sp.]